MTADEAKAKWLEHIKGHQRLAKLSSRGRDIVVPDTTHYIQQIKPQAVLDAVEDVLAQASGNAPDNYTPVTQANKK
jgi:hypothetical protein